MAVMATRVSVVFFPRFFSIISQFSSLAVFTYVKTQIYIWTVCSYIFGACVLTIVDKANYFPNYAMFNLFSQCNFQAFGLKK